MHRSFDISLLIATTCIAVVAVGCVIDLASRTRAFNKLRQLIWQALGAAVIGAGLLLMNQVGDLAIGLGVAIATTPIYAVLAWIASSLTVLLAVVMISRSPLNLAPLPKTGAALLIGALLSSLQFASIESTGQALAGAEAGIALGLMLASIAIGAMLATLAAMRLDQRWLERRAQRELEQAEVERVHRLAYYDSATGLPNRSLFTEKLLKQLVDANRRDASPFGLIYAELRDFRVLLQRHGDARMNRVLKLLAERLGQELVGDDVLARLSYDGLILFVREQGERDTAAAVTGFCGLLSTPIVEGGDSFRFTWGIGHSRYPDQGQSTQALIRTAMTVQRQIGTESPSIASSNRPRYALAS
ncbi:GGDEF domain-containing protein [Nevskia ramosa]|uniref:GGDEF domain-containing protein n=1 Tax=Nevskia ramosa TaxID=64002 RepID=UPI00235792E8|nr:diguanylate cyclase [Nevskia ramosa]